MYNVILNKISIFSLRSQGWFFGHEINYNNMGATVSFTYVEYNVNQIDLFQRLWIRVKQLFDLLGFD